MGSTCHTKREHLPRKRMLSFGQCLNTWGVCPNFDHVIVPKIDKLLTFMFVCFLVIITIIIIISSDGICRSPTELSIMATISESPSNGIKSPFQFKRQLTRLHLGCPMFLLVPTRFLKISTSMFSTMLVKSKNCTNNAS